MQFALLAQHYPTAVIGRANATANACVIFGAFLVQSFVGLVLDLWPITPTGGYDPRDGSVIGVGDTGKGAATDEYFGTLTLSGLLATFPLAMAVTAGNSEYTVTVDANTGRASVD